MMVQAATYGEIISSCFLETDSGSARLLFYPTMPTLVWCSYGALPVRSTYNPIDRMYNPIEITSYN